MLLVLLPQKCKGCAWRAAWMERWWAGLLSKMKGKRLKVFSRLGCGSWNALTHLFLMWWSAKQHDTKSRPGCACWCLTWALLFERVGARGCLAYMSDTQELALGPAGIQQ